MINTVLLALMRQSDRADAAGGGCVYAGGFHAQSRVAVANSGCQLAASEPRASW